MNPEQVTLMEKVQQQAPEVAHDVWVLIDQANHIAQALRVTPEHHEARAKAANDLLMELVMAECHTGHGNFQHSHIAVWEIVFHHLVREGYLVQVDRVRYRARDD